jgi:hypothetical protein
MEEVADTDFSMISYLEQFGGSYKELGLIQYALAHICDVLVRSDLNGPRDYLGLLMVGVDQANLDGNGRELAYRITDPRDSIRAPRASALLPLNNGPLLPWPKRWTTSKQSARR